MAEPARWRPKRSTVWFAVKAMEAWLAGPLFAIMLYAAFQMGRHKERENG